MNNKIIKPIVNNLKKSEGYICKVFEYLKELEVLNPDDKRLKSEIWNLCEAGEIVSSISVELECSDE